jgi:hypothetical protein
MSCDWVLIFSRSRVVASLSGSEVRKAAITKQCLNSLGGTLQSEPAPTGRTSDDRGNPNGGSDSLGGPDATARLAQVLTLSSRTIAVLNVGHGWPIGWAIAAALAIGILTRVLGIPRAFYYALALALPLLYVFEFTSLGLCLSGLGQGELHDRAKYLAQWRRRELVAKHLRSCSPDGADLTTGCPAVKPRGPDSGRWPAEWCTALAEEDGRWGMPPCVRGREGC